MQKKVSKPARSSRWFVACLLLFSSRTDPTDQTATCSLTHAPAGVVRDVRACGPEKPSHDEGATYAVEVSTDKGKVELRADDYGVYKRWVGTLSHMLVMSTAVSVSARHAPPRRD